MSSIEITKHYKKRFRKRVARTSRIERFAEEAFWGGKKLNLAKDSRIRQKYSNIIEEYGSEYSYILYNNFIHIFYTNTAITVYPANIKKSQTMGSFY